MKRVCDLRHVVFLRLKVLSLESCLESSGRRVYEFAFGIQGSGRRVHRVSAAWSKKWNRRCKP